MVSDDDPKEPRRRNRERRHGLFMLDVEMFDELGLPEKLGRKVFRQLDKPLPGRRRFPQPIALLGDRRCWSAVKRYFMEEFGGIPTETTTIAPGHWQENF
jgi:hypothetical protein